MSDRTAMHAGMGHQTAIAAPEAPARHPVEPTFSCCASCLGVEGTPAPNILWLGDGNPPAARAAYCGGARGAKARHVRTKRVLDVVGAAVGLVVFSPLFAAITVMIRLESDGPALFRQRRVGRHGRTFTLLKFRTMELGAEDRRPALRDANVYGDDRLFKLDDDPRATRVGRWLRRTSLDELPQFLNVLLGDMSLVGPRPPLPSEVALYEPQHFCRLAVPQGLTGPWQVSGRNEIRDFEQVVVLEREYMRGWTVWRDVGILLRTVPAVLRGRGAR